MASVFLSYDRKDAAKAAQIAQALERAGHSVWWDMHIKGGAEYGKVIEQALEAADAVVVLWSSRSVESAWVRDEAAAGRDRGCLIPVLIEPVNPPMGFRQYQGLDFTAWKGRGKPPLMAELLDSIGTMNEARGASGPDSLPGSSAAAESVRASTALPMVKWSSIAAALVLLLLGGWWLGRNANAGPPTVGVVAADSSSSSQVLARSLLVKLGALQGNLPNAVRLVEATEDTPDLRVTVSGGADPARPSALVTLASVEEDALLWSQEFNQPGLTRSELEEQAAYATANVLGCAIEEASGEFGRLKHDIRQIFLAACAMRSELGWDARPVLPKLRAVVEAAPRFTPGWSQLLLAESSALSFMGRQNTSSASLARQLRQDITAARRIDPNLAVATLAEIDLLESGSAADVMEVVDKAKSQDPDNPAVLSSRSAALLGIGRMSDAVNDAKRAAELEPLSPSMRANYIYTLAYAGQIEQARDELARAKRLWSSSDAIRGAEYSLELRFGDFEKALKSDLGANFGGSTYAKMRRDPSPANVAEYVSQARKLNFAANWAFAAQALGELRQVDLFYEVFEQPEQLNALREDTYILFRPWMADVRRNPRFMALAARLGLVRYWQQSDQWPDFCFHSKLPYDCRAEAAKYVR